jgi:hypothetical protein
MTDERATHDGTDTENETDSNATQSGGDGGLGRRGFLKGAAASVAGGGALAAVGDTASASGGGGRILVVGRGMGKHTYAVEMEDGDRITAAQHTESNDTETTTTHGDQVVRGEVWNGFVDVLTYTGDVGRVEGDGDLSFHFLDGAFADDERIVVGGESGGEHDYYVCTHSGDVDGAASIDRAETDHGGPRSERSHTPDEFSGHLDDEGVDTLSTPVGDPVQYVHVDGGHVSVDPYRPGRSRGGGDRGEASIVLFYMGDGQFTTFFQNFADVHEAQKGYDYTVLLKHETHDDGIAAKAHSAADAVHEPTRENFEDCVRSLVEAGYTIDLYVYSHGDHGCFKLSDGTFGSEDWYGTADVERLRASFEGDIPLRLVYQVNCWGHTMNDAWRRLGATTAVGSRYVNFFPNQFARFARRWRKGDTVREALRTANTSTSRTVVRQYLKGDIGGTQGQHWATGGHGHWSCTQWAILHGSGGCAEDYFTNRWLHTDDEWRDTDRFGLDGWEFVVYASRKLVTGDATLTR